MGCKLPLLCYENVMLEGESLAEFLADVSLGQMRLDEYLSRKQNYLDTYRKWQNILEKGDTKHLRKLNPYLLTSQIFESLHELDEKIIKKEYEKEFR